jgi:acetylornithine deacetylase/succinyl-diaminopimelate desuccinylase-like protein
MAWRQPEYARAVIARIGIGDEMNTIIRTCAAVCAVIGAQAANAANAYDTQLREMFATVIGMQTSVGLGHVPEMAEYLAGKLREAGFPAEDIHILPVGETASLVVRYRGDGTGGKPIDFMAHMDVVTARREDWQRDPYTLIEENGYFYGRGTIDIKQEVAELTEAFIRLKTEGFKPTRDLVIVFTGDEETAEATTADLATNHRDLIDAEYALNGDGGDGILDEKSGNAVAFFVQGAEKTYADMELTTRNPGGHSSRPRPDNAIFDLADTIKRVQAYRFPVMWNDWTLGNFIAAAKVTPGPLGQAMGRFAANPHDRAAAEVLYKNSSYVGKTRTTCVPTLLTGGHADNALPQMAQVTLSCRIFPGMSIEQVQDRLQRVVGPKVEVHAANPGVVSAASPMNAALMQAIATQVHAIYPGIPIVPEQASYATDGAVFRHAGIPTYGTQASFYKESEDFAHGENECLPVASLYLGEALWYGLMRELASPH